MVDRQPIRLVFDGIEWAGTQRSRQGGRSGLMQAQGWHLAHAAVIGEHRTRSWDMKAVLMTAPAVNGSTTSVADVDEPRPGPGQVAIDVAYAGVNFIDVMARRGDPGYASAWPYVPGLEVAGTIRSVGGGVHGLRAGQ